MLEGAQAAENIINRNVLFYLYLYLIRSKDIFYYKEINNCSNTSKINDKPENQKKQLDVHNWKKPLNDQRINL